MAAYAAVSYSWPLTPVRPLFSLQNLRRTLLTCEISSIGYNTRISMQGGRMPAEFYLNGWLVQPDFNLISRGGRTARVEPKAMQVLALLAVHQGELVRKQTLMSQVWAGTFVSDDVLVRCISELRRVLEDDPRSPVLIQTVNRGGYRLTDQVRDSATAAPENRTELENREAGPRRRDTSRTAWILGVTFAGLLLGYMTYRDWPPSDRVKTVAISPFQNLSSDLGQDGLAQAISGLLRTQLSQPAVLNVAPAIAMGQETSARRVAATRQKVDAVVEGSVLATGERITIRTHLIDPRTNRHLWCGTYERHGAGAAVPYGDLASEVADEIRNKLVPGYQH
jgi:DNA-binding winged helix-turn-helix (wHTH) protein/TolB-like protein